jgi:hypothetical protein
VVKNHSSKVRPHKQAIVRMLLQRTGWTGAAACNQTGACQMSGMPRGATQAWCVSEDKQLSMELARRQ